VSSRAPAVEDLKFETADIYSAAAVGGPIRGGQPLQVLHAGDQVVHPGIAMVRAGTRPDRVLSIGTAVP
jgi:hypothetical protein